MWLRLWDSLATRGVAAPFRGRAWRDLIVAPDVTAALSKESATNVSARPLAVVTGASTGIGLELARLCAQEKFDLINCRR